VVGVFDIKPRYREIAKHLNLTLISVISEEELVSRGESPKEYFFFFLFPSVTRKFWVSVSISIQQLLSRTCSSFTPPSILIQFLWVIKWKKIKEWFKSERNFISN
jgi:hypothetical protein